MNDDRVKSNDADHKLPKPEVSIIRDGESVFKPGMKTYFVDKKDDKDSKGVILNSKKEVVTGVVCVCDRVESCGCDPNCMCQSNCTCDSEHSCRSHSICAFCSCVPVH